MAVDAAECTRCGSASDAPKMIQKCSTLGKAARARPHSQGRANSLVLAYTQPERRDILTFSACLRSPAVVFV